MSASASPATVSVSEVKQEREPIVGICGNHLFTAEQSLLHLSRHPTLSTSPLIITATVANIFTKLRAREIDIGIVEIEDSEAGSYRSVYAQLYGDAHPSRSNSISSSSSGRTTPLPLLLSSTPLSQSRTIVDDGHGEFHGNLYIVGEFAATHEYCLAAVAGVKKEDLQQIYADAHTLSLFDSYLSNLSDELSRTLDCITCHPPRTARTSTTSMTNQKILESQLVDHTELVKSKGKNAAVITTPSHAKRHGLDILESTISLDIPLSTRYVLISRTPAPLSSVMATHAPIKSSLALSVRNQAGAFFKLLSCFALREINLIKFEARPFCATPTDQFSGRTIRDSIFVLDYEPARFTRRTGTDGQSENSYDNRLNEVLLANLREFANDVTPLGFYLANSPQVDPSPNWNMSSLL